MLKSICLSGGGITGFAHIGVLQLLHEKNLLKRIDTIVGTSIGAVVGTLYGLGIVPNDIFNAFANINDNALLKYTDLDSFFQSYGIDTGEYFMAYLVDIFLQHNANPLITFKNYQKIYGKRLVLTGSNITKHETEYFSTVNTPDMRVLDAIRISISIPFLFSAVKYNNHVYVDGGITDNYPLQYCINDFVTRYPHENPLECVLGCNIESLFPRKIVSIEDFIYNIFACSVKKDRRDTTTTRNTIFIEMEIHSTEFSVTLNKRRNMFEIGYERACIYLKTKKPSIKRRHSSIF